MGLRPQARFGAQPPQGGSWRGDNPRRGNRRSAVGRDFRNGKERCARETQEGIHRRLKPISGYFISADWEPSSKQTRLIRHRRRFACFPAPLKSNIIRTFTSSDNKGNGKKRFFRPVAPPVFGRKAHGNRLGRRCIPAPCGEKRLFRHAEAACPNGQAASAFCGCVRPLRGQDFFSRPSRPISFSPLSRVPAAESIRAASARVTAVSRRSLPKLPTLRTFSASMFPTA